MNTAAILRDRRKPVNTSASPALRPLERRPESAQVVGQCTAPSPAAFWHFVEEIKYGSRTFDLVQPLTIRMQHNANGEWEASVSRLGIIAFGYSAQSAIEDLQEEFAVIWDGLAFESDDRLTEDAQELKRALRQLVKAQ